MQIGELEAIWRYPTKSLRGESLSEVSIDSGGIPGDRAASLIVTAGHARLEKPYRGKEHDRLHLSESTDVAVALARAVGVALEPRVHAQGHDFDDAPLSLIVDRWLNGVSAQVGYAVEYTRFRPNLFARAAPHFCDDETALIGSTISIADVLLRVVKPITRCVTITYDPHGGRSDAAILRFLARERAAVLGVYCEVLRAGAVRIGAAVETFDER